MATRKNTSATQAPEINLSTINPVLVTGPGSLESTANNVSAVLLFLSTTIGHLDEDDDVILETKPAWGLALILQACGAALDQSAGAA
jgi:hypothetical protein